MVYLDIQGTAALDWSDSGCQERLLRLLSDLRGQVRRSAGLLNGSYKCEKLVRTQTHATLCPLQ